MDYLALTGKKDLRQIASSLFSCFQRLSFQYITLDHGKAQASATVYSVMETAKANDLNPEKYISHLLTVLPERFAHDPKAQIDDLLPWADELRELCRG